MTLSDRIILMRNGRIEQSGVPRSLYIEPQSTYAADFLGESNLIPATVLTPSAVSLASSPVPMQVRCLPRTDLRTGANVRCFVRPEVIRLLSDGATADNEFDAVIDQAVLAGAVTRYTLRLASGARLSATVLTSTENASRQIGESVRVGFAAADARILVDEGAAP